MRGWVRDETCRLGRVVPMVSTAKGSAHPLATQSQRLLFCMLRHHRRRLIEACIFRALVVRALCALSESVNFCFVSSVALAMRRASRSNSVRSKDRLPLARGAVDPGRVTAGIETPSCSSSTTAARSASAAVGFVELKNRDCTSRTITTRSGKSTATKNLAQMGRTRFIKLKRTSSQIKSLKLTETIRSKCRCRCIVCVLGACLGHVTGKH